MGNHPLQDDSKEGLLMILDEVYRMAARGSDGEDLIDYLKTEGMTDPDGRAQGGE